MIDIFLSHLKMLSKYVSSDAQQHIEILRNDYFGSLNVTFWTWKFFISMPLATGLR
jgi:hypothetical protein